MDVPLHLSLEQLSQITRWVLLGLVAMMAAWETLAPQRPLRLSTVRRWSQHLLLYLLTAQFFRLLFGVGAVALAASVSDNPYGLLNRPRIPYAIRFVAAILIIDLVRYLQHRAYHSISWLWRLHLLHHSDRDFDFSLEFRFHPIEAALSTGSMFLAIAILSPPVLAVAAGEILALTVGILAHGNIGLPDRVEKILRMAVITPDLHRIHHSIDERDQGRNLAVVFVWWDRLFGTYRSEPAVEPAAMQFGVQQIGPEECIRPVHFLGAPFRRLD